VLAPTDMPKWSVTARRWCSNPTSTVFRVNSKDAIDGDGMTHVSWALHELRGDVVSVKPVACSRSMFANDLVRNSDDGICRAALWGLFRCLSEARTP
jgi:hypothetical protein